MPSKRNQGLLQSVTAILKEYDDFFITENKGLSVADLTELRKKLREHGSVYHVIKNNIMRIALENKKVKEVDSFLVGNNGILFTKDPIKSAKVLDAFIKTKKDKMDIRAGFAEGIPVKADYIKDLANLLSKEELVAKLMFILRSPAQKAVIALDAIAKQKNEQN